MDDQTERSPAYDDQEKLIASAIFHDHYAELARFASLSRRRAGFGSTMETSDILHDCYLKLSGVEDISSVDHFRRMAVLAIRQVVVDHARRRIAAKRGGGQGDRQLEECADLLADFRENPEQIVEIAQLMEQLERFNPRWIRILDARYFSGLSLIETAAVMGVSERTARRDWKDVRAWLADQMCIPAPKD